MSFISKMSGLFFGSEAGSTSAFLTRKELHEKIHEHFIQRMEEESTEEGLLFPTDFVIYLSPEDYQRREETFPYSVKEIVNRFNKIIKEKKSSKYHDYIAHAEFWQFQFASFPEDGFMNYEGCEYTSLAPKDVLILSKIHPAKELNEIGDVSGGNERVVTTLHAKNSLNVVKFAINKNALKEVDMRSKDKFRVNFKNFEQIKDEPKSAASSVRAVLKMMDGPGFMLSGGLSNKCPLTSDMIRIAGRSSTDTMGGIPVVRIDAEDVLNPHMTLKYDEGLGTYLVAAYGDVLIEESRVSPDGRHWKQLRDGDQILLNGYALSFNIVR